MKKGDFLHEMAIAEGILGIATKTVEEQSAERVTKVGLLLGELSGVETEALAFCWQSLTKGTAAENAVLELKKIPLMAYCEKCGDETEIKELNFLCRCCGSVRRITTGRELRVEFVEVE